MRFLIADDDPVSRTTLAKILSTFPGQTTTTAENGATAWALLDDPARSFDVLFLDLDMPRLDGFELLQRIRENPLLKSLEIVLVTASNDRATVLKAVQCGVRHYLVKPCSLELVRAKLQQFHLV